MAARTLIGSIGQADVTRFRSEQVVTAPDSAPKLPESGVFAAFSGGVRELSSPLVFKNARRKRLLGNRLRRAFDVCPSQWDKLRIDRPLALSSKVKAVLEASMKKTVAFLKKP